jgi:hypothetical protein
VELSSNDRTLRQVLSSYYFFIPRFQRPYSWTIENVEELWDDIRDSSADYFIGAMVVYPISDDTVSLIDGQQRLSTVVMLLCAIRDAAEAAGHGSLANGTHTFIERTDEDDEERFVLHTQTSYPFLHDEILSRGDAELAAKPGAEEKNLQVAFDRLTQNVQSIVSSAESNSGISAAAKSKLIEDHLRKLRDKVLGLRIVFIEVGNQDDATTIFVTLNSRGEELEPADLVKAHLLQLLPKKGALDRPLEKWQTIIDHFDESAADLRLTEFLLAFWRSRFETKTTARTLTKSIRKRIKKQDATAFLADLVTDSVLYRQINEPEARRWKKEENAVVDSLRFMRDFHITQPMPLLLSLLRSYDCKKVSLSQLRRAYRAVENYHFMFNTIGSKSSSGGMSSFYSRRAINLHSSDDPKKIAVQIDDLVKELNRRRPGNAEFDEAIGNLWYTDERTADKRVIQYILRRFYEHNATDAPDFSLMTIEHFSSQASAATSSGRLGNLVLVSRDLNGKLGSKTIAQKQADLKAAKQWVPPELLTVKRWGSAEIDKRTSALTSAARTKVFT